MLIKVQLQYENSETVHVTSKSIVIHLEITTKTAIKVI